MGDHMKLCGEGVKKCNLGGNAMCKGNKCMQGGAENVHGGRVDEMLQIKFPHTIMSVMLG